MEEVERYLADMNKALFGMDKKTREGIVAELRSHISESLADGASSEETIKNLEHPRSLARRYKQIYGYGTLFNILFSMDAIILAIIAVPYFPYLGYEPYYSLLFAFAIVSVGTAGLFCGKKVGLAVGIASTTARILSFATIYLLSDDLFLRTDDALAFVIVSMIFIPVGYGIGRAKEKWPGNGD